MPADTPSGCADLRRRSAASRARCRSAPCVPRRPLAGQQPAVAVILQDGAAQRAPRRGGRAPPPTRGWPPRRAAPQPASGSLHSHVVSVRPLQHLVDIRRWAPLQIDDTASHACVLSQTCDMVGAIALSLEARHLLVPQTVNCQSKLTLIANGILRLQQQSSCCNGYPQRTCPAAHPPSAAASGRCSRSPARRRRLCG